MSLPYIVIEGRLVADGELRFTKTGKAVLNLRVAASDSRKTDAGEWETTEQIFVNVAAFEGAEALAEQALKGAKVTVAGRIYQRQYDKSDGTKGQSLDIKYPMVKILPARDGQQQGQSQPRQQSAGDPWGAPAAAKPDPWGAPPAPNDEPPF